MCDRDDCWHKDQPGDVGQDVRVVDLTEGG